MNNKKSICLSFWMKWYNSDYSQKELGNFIHFKNSNGFEELYEYDDKGNLVYRKDSDGYEEWRECDEEGNVVNELVYYSSGVWELNGEEYEVKKEVKE